MSKHLFPDSPSHIRGVLLAVGASAAFASMHVTVRYLTANVHPFEVAFFRNCFGFLLLLPWLIRLDTGALKTKRIGSHLIRAAFNAFAMLMWYTALSMLPVANAVSLTLLGPVFIALGAVVFLGEAVTVRRWVGIGIAMAGALLIVRPGIQAVGLGTMLVLASSVSVSIAKLIAKSLSRTDNTHAIVGYLTLFMALFTFVPALTVWSWPTVGELVLLAMVGGFGTTAHVLYIRAYKLADVSLVEPAMFMRMVWAALIGLVVFAEFPDIWTWIGSAIVVLGTTHIARKQPVRSQPTGESLP